MIATTESEFGRFLAQIVVPSSGSTAMSTSGPSPVPSSSPTKSVGASPRLALADDDAAAHVEPVQLAPHGVSGGLVGELLVAAAAHQRRRDRRALGDAHELAASARGRSPFQPPAACRLPRAQSVSIRIICGRPKISPSASMLASALRTACSVVECVMIVTG